MKKFRNLVLIGVILCLVVMITKFYILYLQNLNHPEFVVKFTQTSAMKTDTMAVEEKNENTEIYFVNNATNTCNYLPRFQILQHCYNISGSKKRPKCFYQCSCYKTTASVLPGIASHSGFPLKSDMGKIELETAYDNEFVDILDTTSVSNSIIYLKSQRQIRVGDDINVIIQLKDGRGRPRRMGGDDVRVRMLSLDNVFKAVGEVKDLYNGRYIATFKALWEGKSKISVILSHSREAISTMLRWQRLYRATAYIQAVFQNSNNNKESVFCSPFPTISDYKSVCNLTVVNYGQPLYCGKPSNPKLGCNHITYFGRIALSHIPLNTAQLEVVQRSRESKRLHSTLTIQVDKGKPVKVQTKCRDVPKMETWDTSIPSGYFNESQWISMRCVNNINKKSIMDCINNTVIIIIGDSTTRQYYSFLKDHIVTDCHQITENWTVSAWHKTSKCVSASKNLSITWEPHELPSFPSHVKQNGKNNLKSVGAVLNEIPSTGRVILVIHYYVHLAKFHNSLFRHKIRSLKEPIKKALSKNNKLIIFIKSPYAIAETKCASHFSDFQSRIFIDILQRELAEFKHSLIYLNIWDMSIADSNMEIHPGENIVWQHLRLLFGYICNDSS